MRLKNKVLFTLVQVLPALVSKTGGLQDERVNRASFETETAGEITAKKLALWLVVNLDKFVKLARLQGEKGFNLNKPINITVKVNNKEETFTMKYSLNVDKIVAAMEKTPKLVAAIFSPTPSIATINEKSAWQAIEHPDTIVVAKAIKDKSKEIIELSDSDTPKLSLADVDLTEKDLEEIL